MSLSTIIKNALACKQVSVSASALVEVKAIQEKLRAVDTERQLSKDGNNSRAFSFIQLSPVKFDKQHLFGSHVKSDCAQELTVCPAKKNSEGDWVPDTDNLYFKTLISQRELSDAMFNVSKYEGQPITFTELNGSSVDAYIPSITPEDQYDTSVKEAIEDAQTAIRTALAQAQILLDPDVRLNKTNKEQLVKALGSLSRYSSQGFDFDLELVREHLEKDVHHIKTEIISSVTGYIQNLSKTLQLEYKTNKVESYFKSFFELYASYKKKSGLEELLGKYYEYCSEDEKALIQKQLNHHADQKQMKRFKNAQIASGMLKIGNPQGSPEYFFGDARSVNSYFQMEFSFGVDNVSDYGEVRFTSSSSLLTLQFTSYQLMELLQSSLQGHWVKTTLSRFMGVRVERPELKELEHDEMQIDIPGKCPESIELSKLIDDALSIVNTKSTSMASRIAIDEKITLIAEKLNIESDARYEAFSDAKYELSDKFMKKGIESVSDMLETVGERHPNLREKIMLLTSQN